MAQFRPIAAPCTWRKILSYLCMWSLPALTLTSGEIVFMPDNFANTGIYMSNRARDLSRERREMLMCT